MIDVNRRLHNFAPFVRPIQHIRSDLKRLKRETESGKAPATTAEPRPRKRPLRLLWSLPAIVVLVAAGFNSRK